MPAAPGAERRPAGAVDACLGCGGIHGGGDQVVAVIRIREPGGTEIWPTCRRHQDLLLHEAVESLSAAGAVEVSLPL